MANADVLDLLGLNVDLRQKVDQADFRRHVGRGHRMTGIPQQVFLAVLDEIATEYKLKLQIAIRISVREALVDRGGSRGGPAVETRESYLRRLRGCRQSGESVGACANRDQSHEALH